MQRHLVILNVGKKASMHPNEEDFSRAKEFVKAMQRKIALREKYLNMKK